METIYNNLSHLQMQTMGQDFAKYTLLKAVKDNYKVRKGAKIRNRYNQVPHLTQDTTWESDINTIKQHKQEPRGQPFPRRWPQNSNEQTRKHKTQHIIKVSNGAKIRNRYNQVPHLTQDTNGKVTNSQKTPQTRAKRSALSQQVTTKHI